MRTPYVPEQMRFAITVETLEDGRTKASSQGLEVVDEDSQHAVRELNKALVAATFNGTTHRIA